MYRLTKEEYVKMRINESTLIIANNNNNNNNRIDIRKCRQGNIRPNGH